MTRKVIATWGMILLLLASIVGTAAAQTGDTPEVTPTTEPTVTTNFYHPVVQILSAYFGRKGVTDLAATPTAVVTVDPNAPVDPNATPTPEPVTLPGPEEIAEQIAQYHEDGMGFGVLVKLYAMAEVSAEKCAVDPTAPTAAPDAPVCTVVTVEELVTAVEGGAGMGDLFKEYGKPALLGVGHVKKELKALEGQPTEPVVVDGTDEAPTAESLIDTDGKKLPKDKNPNAKPPKVKTPKPKIDK